ncbi:hypothetical protein TNIN_446721 [Trichonephila inaurata madagascariensis]|uniref:Uncharacterized protein n=1 Tax=Trichonephila inaurata madagascariensis TaxID=2747483 RepID=A0A8X7CDU6_9ARAC|nr:hypothetical protein TNIN_446721 [Trichonephila inaurata madagascariensis]
MKINFLRYSSSEQYSYSKCKYGHLQVIIITANVDEGYSPEDAPNPSYDDRTQQKLQEGCQKVIPEGLTLLLVLSGATTEHCESADKRSCKEEGNEVKQGQN